MRDSTYDGDVTRVDNGGRKSQWQRKLETEKWREESERKGESKRISALSRKTTCTGNVVANGRKWTVVEEEYGERKRQKEQEATPRWMKTVARWGWKRGKEEGGRDGTEEKEKNEIPLLLEEERPGK